MHSTDKSNLTKILERTVDDHGVPENVDVRVYDGFFILQSMVNVPQSYKDIAMLLLKSVIDQNNAKEVYLLFDVYKKKSIKDCQHARRNNYSGEFSIQGNIHKYSR